MGIDTTGYKVVLLLHILAVVVAFGPYFLYPSLLRADATQKVARMHLYLSLPAMVLLWVFGMGLVGMSDDAWSMSDGWIIAALITWLVALVVSWFLVRPALEAGGEPVKSKLSAGVGITHLCLIVGIYLMVFRPGA